MPLTRFQVEKIERCEEWSKTVSFRKARVGRNGQWVEIDWAHEAAFRFFPVVADETLGWR